ncbi:GerAB/ArcD/ProY family transporter [Paenibacillus lautus]|uniref:Spore gernimation protein n=1 Tax=Paenibacillus lautus TaxID=1401 RepID=A0A385TPK6_PAELA|nr:GerAB/ArcD/ProY family transporter [Paenibacillus lautus]AYB44512.1 spore gernimation protein [Paenibacillus lautus]
MKEKLSQFHTAILIYMIQTGVYVFSITQVEAQYFGTNGWLITIPASILVCLNIYQIYWVYRLGEGQSIFDILEKSIPKFILAPFYLAISTVWALIGCLVAKQYVLIFQMFAFPTTNPMVFKIAIDVLAFMLLTKGLYNISKASTVFFWSTIWMSLLLLYYAGEFRIERLTPYIFKDGSNMLEGFFQIYLAFLGYELCLLLFPYTDKKTKLFRAVIYGNLIRTVSYTIMSFVSFGVVGSDMLKVMLFPLLDLLAYIKLPFIERIENLFYGFFLFTTLITLVLYFWAAGESTQRVFPKIKINAHYFFIILVALLISYIPAVLNRIREWLLFLGYIQIGFAFIMPMILIVLLLWQRRKRQRAAQC